MAMQVIINVIVKITETLSTNSKVLVTSNAELNALNMRLLVTTILRI
jgi:hypothetical protein